MFALLAIPKTGSDTLSEVLASVFRPEYTLALNKPLTVNGAVPDLSKVALIRGHFGLLDLIRDGVYSNRMVMLSCMRDPVERTVSTYRYALAKAQNQMEWAPPMASDLEIAKLSFREFVDQKLWPNEQLSWLYGKAADEQLHFDDAMHDLTKHVSYVGLTEELDRFCQLLNLVYGWLLFPDLHRNVTTIKSDSVVVTEQDIAAVREKCALDIKAYEFFQDRFQKQAKMYDIPERGAVSAAALAPRSLGLGSKSEHDRIALLAFGEAFTRASEAASVNGAQTVANRHAATARRFMTEAASDRR